MSKLDEKVFSVNDIIAMLKEESRLIHDDYVIYKGITGCIVVKNVITRQVVCN